MDLVKLIALLVSTSCVTFQLGIFYALDSTPESQSAAACLAACISILVGILSICFF